MAQQKKAADTQPQPSSNKSKLGTKEKGLLSKRYTALADVFDAKSRLARLDSQLTLLGIAPDGHGHSAEW